jgi:hypothetical protein
MTAAKQYTKDAYKDSMIVSVLLCIAILVCFIQTSDQVLHWFIIPVTLCGILIGIDAVDWLLGRLNIFDPVGVLGMLGLHFFFLSPLLHVTWNLWYIDASHPPDWRPWLGYLAILNFLGLLVYRAVRSWVFWSSIKPANPTIWQFNPKRFPLILFASLVLAGVIQLLVYSKYGGVIGYITAATDLEGRAESFSGMGLVFLFSESFPILSMIGFAAYARHRKHLRTWHVLIIILAVFLVLQLFFGGLRGSRSNTIWALFWALGIIHFWLRTVNKKLILFGLVFLVFFMYIYGFFKGAGLEGVKTALEGQEARAALSAETGRSWEGLVLADLARSDLQAFLLYRLMRQGSDYEYAWGRTYFSAALSPIPKAILPGKPVNKSKEGTDAQYGMGSYEPGLFVSSKVYGLAGEAMLNFSPLAVPVAFVCLGIVVGSVRACLFRWHPSDTRFLLFPMFVTLCFIVLVGDADNVLFSLVKDGSFPCIVVFLSSSKTLVSS